MLNPLTSFRFIAALAVFLSHLGSSLFREGYIGVSFFFVLSGFILAYNYHSRLDTLDASKVKSFYLARIARIYPIHVLTLLIAIPLVISSLSDNLITNVTKFVSNLLLLQGFIPYEDFYFSFNNPSWSLSAEMFFYVLFPILIFWMLRIKSSLKLIMLILVSWVTSIAIVSIFKDSSFQHWLFYVFPLFRLFDFIIGIALGLLFIKYKTKFSHFGNTNFEIISLLLLMTAIIFHPYIHQAFRWGTYYIPFMSLVIFVFAFQKGLISKILSNKYLVYLGEISFSFYMIHKLIIRYIQKFVGWTPLLVVVAFLSSILISHLLFKYYETPTRRWIRGGKSKKTIFPPVENKSTLSG